MIRTLQARTMSRLWLSLMTLLLLVFIWVAIKLAYSDLQYFRLHQEVKQWSLSRPPTEARVDAVLSRVQRLPRHFNPNLLWVEAIAWEWQAYQHSSDARFYLINSEHVLRKAIELRPKDARLWAHYAIILDKQVKPQTVVDAARAKAKALAGYDLATAKLLAYFDR